MLVTPEPRLDALLPFGPDVGDHDFPFTLDGSSPPVSFSAVFFGSSEDTIYVCICMYMFLSCRYVSGYNREVISVYEHCEQG